MRAKGGILSVSLKATDIPIEKAGTFLDLAPGQYAQLSVTDTGHGMDVETRRRIFEPFFTTKPQGEGTGLGLATVHGIVRSYKGAIHVESAPGQGARFDLLFPICLPVPAAAAPRDDTNPLPRGSETILFVDDEEPIARSNSLALERLGYTVQTAGNGLDALALFEAKPDGFALVITDQTMPKLTGFELARHLLRLRPGLPIILCTGFSETVSRQDAQGAGIRDFMVKPIEFRSLARAVRAAIDGPTQTR
jgi:CheY-like chemotaxis protein